MEFFAQAIQGQVPGARAIDRRRELKRPERPVPGAAGDPEGPLRAGDNDEVLIHVEPAQGARSLAGNESEESHEDRQEHGVYGQNQPGRSLDLEA
ncbi:MAG: hypothetical protein AAGB51_14605 [Planctomycetota bacterium]